MDTEAADIWIAVGRGDERAFEKLFRTHYQPLCRYAMQIVDDADNAEEAVQDTFFNIWQKRETLDLKGSPTSYLYRAVHNTCINQIKKIRVRRAWAEDRKSVNRNEVHQTETMETRELASKIEEAIDQLPPQCQEVFRMSRYEGRKYKEIAEALDISVKTVENHMGKALKLLRQHLQEYLQLIVWFILLMHDL